MDELDDVAHEMPNIVQERHSKNGVPGISSHIKPVDDELETALKQLKTLPFHNENQKTVFFERLKRLQDRHVIQIFKLGVAPLLTSPFESSELLEEVMKLFELCFSFCYSTDELKRVSFEYYASVLKFCFRTQPSLCLSTEVASSLLQLVQIFQEGNLGTIVCNQNEQTAKPNFQLKGTKHFFHELLALFAERRDGGYIAEIVAQTKRFASADAKASCIKEYLVGNKRLRSDHLVLPFFLTNWIKLLKLANVSSGFALALAKRDTLRYAKEYFPLLLSDFQHSFHSTDSVVCYFVAILEEMNIGNSQLCLPVDDERLGIFFKHMHHSRQNRNVAIISVKLLATTSIPNGVLREVLAQFFKEEEPNAQQIQQPLEMIKAIAFDHLLKILSLLPDGRIVNKVMKFWRETPLIKSDYQHCQCLLALFAEETNSADYCDLQERAERTLNFLHWLPSYLLRFIIFWGPFLSSFIKAFPASFNKRPELLVFIHKAVLAARVPATERQDYVILEHEPQFQFLTWLSRQCFSKQMKYEMLWLLMCCTEGEPLGHTWTFSINIIKQLKMPFGKKKIILRDATRFAKLLQGQAKESFQGCVENIIKCHTLELKDDILSEILDFVKRFDSKERPLKTIPVNVLQLLSELSQIPTSGDIRLKLLQMAKESDEGLVNSTQMLKILETHCYRLRNDHEKANGYFDSLDSVFGGILKGKSDLRAQFCEQVQTYGPLSQVPEMWAEVAKLISLGSFNEEIDNHCCCSVLNAASDLSSSEMLQLFYEVRSSAKKVVELLKDRNDTHAFTNGFEYVPLTFVSSLEVVLRSKGLTGMEKLLLVRKVCDIFLSCPERLTEQSMEIALTNLIPSSCLQHSSCSQDENLLRLEFNHVEAILDNPTIMRQLSRIPAYSLCAVISEMTSDSFSADSIAEIYNFIGSQGDLDQTFFENLLSVVEIAIKESNSLKNVLQILMELVSIVRTTRSELIPLTMVIFGHLLENRVSQEERLLFINEAVMTWNFSPNVHVLSYLEVPQLLWKAISTKTPAERSDLIDRLQDILSGANENAIFSCVLRLKSTNPQVLFVRKVHCCEFEWLVLYSSLSKTEAALALNLIFHYHDLKLRCFDFSDVCIEDSYIKFVRHGSQTERLVKVSIATMTNATTAPTRNVSSVSEPHDKILTPLVIAEKLIFHLKRLLEQNEDLPEKAFLFWDHLFITAWLYCSNQECRENLNYFDDCADAFLSILSESASTEILFHWIAKAKHHVCQCSEVILNACKHSCFTGDVTQETLFKFQGVVHATMEKMRLDASRDAPLFPMRFVRTPCFRPLMPQLRTLSNLLEFRLPIEVKTAVLEVFETDMQAGVAIAEMLSFWSCKQQALRLVELFKKRYQDEGISSLNPEHKEFVFQLLRAFAQFCINSCEGALISFEKVIALYDPQDPYGFNRLPKWRQEMIGDGFSSQVIDSWCVAFLTTPPEDISSRDVDAILDLNSGAFKLVDSQLSQTIKRCLYPSKGFQVSQKEGIKAKEAKERLRLAKLLGEFINTLKRLKPEENHDDTLVKEIVVCGCYELCKARENQTRRNELYIIHEQGLKALFTEVFGKQRKTDDDVCKTHKAAEEGSTGPLAFERQTSYLHENLPHIVSHRGVYQPLLVLLRRWLSQIVVKPTLASLTKEVVQLIFSVPSEKQDRDLLLQVHNLIQDRLLSLEENQALMAQLEASGYNQNEQGHAGLWSSPKVECSGYLSKLESPDRKKYEKKLTQVLRQLWNEWKDILYILGIAIITVGENDVCTQDLFDLHTSLNDMEQQVAAVKKEINQMETEYLDKRIQQCIDQMIRKEQRHRARIKTLYKGTKTSEAFGNERAKVTKFSAVWENRFLENVKLCSERIPGCYAPNGFHSEKPVLCALSVDNRIVTIFKEEKNGNRQEVENVEVKLYEAGMYVYGLYTSGHEYVTDELWAAFYKMLLDDRLVPRIALSNESPGFDWIKDFVKPAKSLPYPWKWERHQGIVPPEEDYFEHAPIRAGLWPAMYGLTEFVILTNENVKTFQFKDFEDACTFENNERRTKEMVREAIQKLKDELRLLHGDNETVRTALAGRLAPVIKETMKCIVDGKGPTKEEVEKMIDMDRLTYKNPHVQRTEESGQQYAAAILRACKITHCAE